MPGFRMGTSSLGSNRNDALGGYSPYYQNFTSTIDNSTNKKKLAGKQFSKTKISSDIAGILQSFFITKSLTGNLASNGIKTTYLLKSIFSSTSFFSKNLAKKNINYQNGQISSTANIGKKFFFIKDGQLDSNSNIVFFISRAFQASLFSQAIIQFSQGTSLISIFFTKNILSTGSMRKNTQLPIYANIGGASIYIEKIILPLTGAIVSSASIVASVRKYLNGITIGNGVVNKYLTKTALVSTVTSLGGLLKRFKKTSLGTITSSMYLFRSRLWIKSFSSSISSASVLTSIYAQGQRILEEIIILIKDLDLETYLLDKISITINVISNKFLLLLTDKISIETDIDVQ